MRKRAKPAETTKLYYSLYSNQGAANLKKWLRVRTKKQMCDMALAMLRTCYKKRIKVVNQDGTEEEFVLGRKTAPKRIPVIYPGMRVFIPGTSYITTAGENFHLLMEWLNIGARSGILQVALQLLHECARAEIQGSRVFAVDPTTNAMERLHVREETPA